MLTITDQAGVVEGQTVTAICNGKTFSSTIKNGMAKISSSEVGTYTITAGEYSTMLICPYFGRFSTDIYSGTLKVTCTETDGNGKTCQVRSCDNNYEFTSSYNLTQTFDSSLKLTFLGIPAGKYLITVDDRYRFYKEIVSIQNINTVDVELKQWLYKDGDECVHNTGGWIQCLVNGGGDVLKPNGNTSAPLCTHSTYQYAEKLGNAIRIYQKCVAQSVGFNGAWGRNPVWSNVFYGTSKAIPITLSAYTQMICVCSQSLTMALRTGALNNSATSTSTATVLLSSSTGTVNINVPNSTGSVVIGKNFTAAGQGLYPNTSNWVNRDNLKNNPGDINYEFSALISRVYLI